RTGGKRYMRLRSGKSDVPKGSVVPRLLKYVQPIERTDNQPGASCRSKPACAQCSVTVPNLLPPCVRREAASDWHSLLFIFGCRRGSGANVAPRIRFLLLRNLLELRLVGPIDGLVIFPLLFGTRGLVVFKSHAGLWHLGGSGPHRQNCDQCYVDGFAQHSGMPYCGRHGSTMPSPGPGTLTQRHGHLI